MRKSLILVLALVLALSVAMLLTACGHEHTAGTEYMYNDTNHTATCAECGESMEAEAHDMQLVDQTEATCLVADTTTYACVCGYEKVVVGTTVECVAAAPVTENVVGATKFFRPTT